jgi:Rhomboid family.
MLGVPLEMVHRWWRVSLVYLTGVLAGSLAVSITDPGTYLAGARSATRNKASCIIYSSNCKRLHGGGVCPQF